jgi:hypothetical protein
MPHQLACFFLQRLGFDIPQAARFEKTKEEGKKGHAPVARTLLVSRAKA